MKTFSTTFSDYQILTTEDGDLTIHSGHYNEACHSMAGASKETQHNYVEGCHIKEKIQKKSTTIFEVGFGVGIGPVITDRAIDSQDFPLTFISTEIDPGLVEWVQSHNSGKMNSLPDFDQLEIKSTGSLNYYYGEKGKHRLFILIGDARKTIKQLAENRQEMQIEAFDAIYQDAFSPKRNPSLWTIEWFRDLAELSHQETEMSTYSASNSIRKSMVAANWGVHQKSGFGPKRAMTWASLGVKSSEEVLLSLSRSPVEAFTDYLIKDRSFDTI